jgi:hypothetical protein
MKKVLFDEQFESLVKKYGELLVGDGSPEMIEKIKIWAVYQQIARTMPPLTKHWGDMHPEGRKVIREWFEEIKQLNEQLKETRSAQSEPASTGENE